jgi:hypothetical protein
MTNEQFVKLAKKERGWNVYNVKKSKTKGHSKYTITYSQQLSETTQTTERVITYYCDTLDECAKFLYT